MDKSRAISLIEKIVFLYLLIFPFGQLLAFRASLLGVNIRVQPVDLVVLPVIPILLFWEASASIKIFSSVKPKVFWAVAAMLIILGIFPYYRTFYTRPLTHKSSESYFYREIARWISKNEDKNVVVTTLFGPTEKMTKYYLGEVPSNVSFQNFDLIKEGASENTYYVGLPGQFVKKGMDLEEKEKTESRVQIIDKIIGEGELVFEYGENLWIGYQK